MARAHPAGYWTAVRKAVREHLAAEGLEHLSGLGDEYVNALRTGDMLRVEASKEPFVTLKSGRVVAHPGHEAADRELRRAIQLAKAIGLPGKPREGRASVDDDPFAHLDNVEPIRRGSAGRPGRR